MTTKEIEIAEGRTVPFSDGEKLFLLAGGLCPNWLDGFSCVVVHTYGDTLLVKVPVDDDRVRRVHKDNLSRLDPYLVPTEFISDNHEEEPF